MRILSYFILMLSVSSASAEIFMGPGATAQGGAGRAGLQGPESVFLNPALTPLIQTTEIAFYYKDGYSGPQQHRNTMGIGLVDSNKDVVFPGAFHYLRVRDTGRTATPVDGEIYHLALGKNISDRVVVGVSGYMLDYEVKYDRSYTQWNASLGTLFLITNNMGVAYVLNNMAGPSSKVPSGLREDTNQGVGIYGAVAEIARLRFDVTRNERFNPDKKLTFAVGMESMVNDFVTFRLGFRREELTNQRFYAAGFGFNGPKLKADYSFEKNDRGTRGAVHSVDLRMPF